MPKQIIWTKRSQKKLFDTVSYLEQSWGPKVAESYVKKCFSIIDIIADHPERGTLENVDRGIRGFLITKHDRLFYRVTASEIIVLNFFDTRSKPGKNSKGV